MIVMACNKGKSAIEPQGSLQSSNNSNVTLSEIKQSDEFKNFVNATNNLLGLVDIANTSPANIDSATQISNKSDFSLADLNYALEKLGIDKDLYQHYLRIQFENVKAIQNNYGLDAEQIQNAIQNIIENNSDLLYNPNKVADPSTACKVSAYSVFALESVGCMSLGTIPVIGQALVIPCTTAAIAHLTATLVQCYQPA